MIIIAQIKTENLNELFSGSKLYKIPDYQRGYSWQKRQLIDFWEDLQNIHNNRKHYTGQLSIKQIDDETKVISEDKWKFENGDAIFDVLDGQQRLTTIIILIQQIVDFAKSNSDVEEDGEIFINANTTVSDIEKKYLFDKARNSLKNTYYFDYYPENPSYKYFHREIYGDPNIGDYEESFYTHNLMNAKNFFLKNLEVLYESYGNEGIANLYKKLTTSLQFIPYEIGKDFDVFVAFETMNNRGKPLSNLEILKNRLIYISTLFNDSVLSQQGKVQLRQKINDAWKDIYQNLGKNKKSVLSDNEFLRAHWIMYYKYSRQRGNDYIEFLLNEKFIVQNVKQNNFIETSGLENIEVIADEDNDIDLVNESELLISKIDDNLLSPEEILKYVDDLQKASSAWFLSFNPFWSDSNILTEDEKMWMERINRLGVNYFRPLITAAIMQKKSNQTIDLVELFKNIERWLFISFHLSGQRSNTKSSQYYNLSRDLHVKEKSIDNIIKQLKDHVNELFDDNDRYNINRFYDDMAKKFQNNDGYYSWSDRHYFLFEYEASIRIEEGEQKLEWSTFVKNEKDKVTIEHILPQTIRVESLWYSVIEEFNNKKIKYLTNSLGNLLALSRSKNSKFSNDSFENKKNGRTNDLGTELYRGYRHGSHSEIEVAKNVVWTSEQIVNRGLHLLSFMSDRWELNLSNEQKEKLLFLDFLCLCN